MLKCGPEVPDTPLGLDMLANMTEELVVGWSDSTAADVFVVNCNIVSNKAFH